MRFVHISLAAMFVLTPVLAQEKTEGPTNEKAQKTYKEAFELLHDRRTAFALDDVKKADKQDGGHCLACQKQMMKYGVELGLQNRSALRTAENQQPGGVPDTHRRDARGAKAASTHRGGPAGTPFDCAPFTSGLYQLIVY